MCVCTPWRVRVCVRLCIGRSVQALQVTPFRVLRIGSLEAWTVPCGHLGLRRPPDQSSRPRCFRVCRTPTPFPFGAVVLTRRAFGGCSRGMAGTEVEKGDPAPGFPFLLGVLGEGGSLETSRGSLAPLAPSLFASDGRGLLTAQPAGGSGRAPPPWAASLSLRCQELRHPCPWQRPKPRV